MIKLDPLAYYTRSDLAELLGPTGVDVDTYIGRLRPRKVFRQLFWGEDLIEAQRQAKGLGEADEPVATRVKRPAEKRRRKKRSSDMGPLERLLGDLDGQSD